MMKKVILLMSTLLIIMGAGLYSIDCSAADEYVDVFVDCGDGTCHSADGFDTFWGENRAKVGSTVASVFNFDEDPTDVDQDFVGWYAYNKDTGEQLGGLLTTNDVVNYVIPNHGIKFIAQWAPRAGYPVKNIGYGVFWNGEGEPCYDVKISIIYNDICYSGYGIVSIPESVYSTWSGKVTYRYELFNDVYVMYDGRWTKEDHEYEGTVKDFLKYETSYNSANTTGKGRDEVSSRRKVNDCFYQAAFIAPEVSFLSSATADQVISNTEIVPPTYTVATEVFQAGVSYDAAVNAAQTILGTNNVVVVDITLKDDNGVKVSQLSDYVDVRVDIPATYTIQPGNTVVVYYLNDNGTLKECETVYNDDDPNNRYVVFKTNHFSVYVLVESEVETVKEPEVVLEPEKYPEESEAENEEIADSVETDETDETDETTETDVNAKTDETSEFEKTQQSEEDDNSNHSNNSYAWIIGFVALAVILVFIFTQKVK